MLLSNVLLLPQCSSEQLFTDVFIKVLFHGHALDSRPDICAANWRHIIMVQLWLLEVEMVGDYGKLCPDVRLNRLSCDTPVTGFKKLPFGAECLTS